MGYEIIGHRFGKLVVNCKSSKKALSGSMYECICDCGNTAIVAGSSLTSGHTRSCGCLRRLYLQQHRPARKHGGESIPGKNHRERLYMVWSGMKERCYSPKNRRYKDYGGRGIEVCNEWRTDYGAFRDWAMANGYDPEAPRGACTIDRIDVDGNYCPDNCRWVDNKTQCNNKRNKKRKAANDGKNY